MRVQAQWPGDESQQCDVSAQDSSECSSHTLVPPPKCICSDVQVQPDAKVPNSPVFTCAQQYNNGNCNQPFMKDSIVGIPEGEHDYMQP